MPRLVAITAHAAARSSWKASRSPVTIITSMPVLARAARRAWRSRRRPRSRAPSRCGSRTPRRAAARCGHCSLSRSGRERALGLVVARRPPRGRTCPRPTPRRVGFGPYSVRIFTSIDAKPKIALVGMPLRGGDRLREREERAVDEPVPVDQEQLAVVVGGHPRILGGGVCPAPSASAAGAPAAPGVPGAGRACLALTARRVRRADTATVTPTRPAALVGAHRAAPHPEARAAHGHPAPG